MFKKLDDPVSAVINLTKVANIGPAKAKELQFEIWHYNCITIKI